MYININKILINFKLFIGFDYECPRGHRFMLQTPNKLFRHRRISENLNVDGTHLLETPQALWRQCATCKQESRQLAQLMHIHLITPKAPVMVILSPKVKFKHFPDGYFYPGLEEICLERAKYYVMRLPLVYIKPPSLLAKNQETDEGVQESWISPAQLMANFINIKHTPIV